MHKQWRVRISYVRDRGAVFGLGGGAMKIRHEVPVDGTKCCYRGHEMAEKNSWGSGLLAPQGAILHILTS